MKPSYVLSLLLILTFPTLQYGEVATIMTGILTAVAVAGDIATVSLFIFDLFTLKREDANSKLASETLYTLGKAFEEYEVYFESRMNENHITDELQLFETTVGFPAHNLLMTADKYLKSQTNFMEQLLISECLKNEPYTNLNNLHTMIADKWFLTQAENENYRLPDIKNIRIRIFHAMKELVLSHFICMAVQGEPVEETVLTDVIRSAVSNITNTIDKELKIIENSFFPKYVVKEVYKLIAETAFPNDDLERRTNVAKITLQMLKNVFGKGIIVNSQNQPLFTRDYEVQVSKSPTFGKMHENAIVDIKINNDFILITRANAFGLNANFNGGKTAISSCEVHNYTSKYFDDYDVFALTTFTDYSSHPVRIPGKRDRLLHFKCCSCLSFCCKVQAAVITSVPKGSLIDAVPQHSVSIALENERQMQNIRKLRMAVRAEIAAIRESKKTTTTTTILATTITPTTDVLLNEINDTTPQPIIVLENEKQLKFIQDIREVLKLELKAAAVKNSGSSSVSELISFVILINFWIIVFSNTL